MDHNRKRPDLPTSPQTLSPLDPKNVNWEIPDWDFNISEETRRYFSGSGELAKKPAPAAVPMTYRFLKK